MGTKKENQAAKKAAKKAEKEAKKEAKKDDKQAFILAKKAAENPVPISYGESVSALPGDGSVSASSGGGFNWTSLLLWGGIGFVVWKFVIKRKRR